VVYADGQRSKGREARIAWMLLYLGARAVALLDGGWQGWLAHAGVVERRRTLPLPGQFVIAVQPHRRCSLSDLLAAHRDGTSQLLVDIRSPREFAGRVHRYQPRMGHLPAARLVPFTALFHPGGRYLDRRRYHDRILPLVKRAVPLIAYCEVGVRACTFALLHEVYSGDAVPVYDGSLMEWALDPALPVCTGQGGGAARISTQTAHAVAAQRGAGCAVTGALPFKAGLCDS
jgi:thiosulfate/3-mercaptopyruvate sulfurtransferase